MALVLQIVKNGNGRARAIDGRGEAGVEERVQTQAGGGQRQRGLLPNDARGAKRGPHGLRAGVKVRLHGTRPEPVSRFVKTKYWLRESIPARAASSACR